MQYKMNYSSPVGVLTITTDGTHITGLWFDNQSDYERKLNDKVVAQEQPIFQKVRTWLDHYFQGDNPTIDFPLKPTGTAFREQVWEILTTIPSGETMTYGEIADKIARVKGKDKMSAQAVGGAVGSNPISILIPCHRVVGADGSLTGYGGGIDKKIKLLEIETVEMAPLYRPKHSTKP